MPGGGEFEDCIQAAQRGDSAALAAVLATCHPRLRARAEARLSGAAQARISPEDVLQEVYVQVFRQIAEFENRGPNSFLSWVFTILDHKLIDAQRAMHRQARDVAREVAATPGSDADSYWNLLDDVYADSDTPSRVVRRAEALRAVARCIDKLPEPYRQVLQLRYLEARSLAEVAAHLGKSEPAVAMQCQRALRALRSALDQLGEFTRGD